MTGAVNTPLIEAIARKLCEQHIREVRRWDTDPAKLEANLPGAVDVNWQDHVALAEAALTAITEAGYICAPKEPTPAMISEAWKAISAEKRLLGFAKLGPGPAAREVYRAMISAAQGDGA